MAKISWSFESKDDLKQIYEYIANDSEFYANKVIDKIITRVSGLKSHIYLGRVVPEFGNIHIR